MSSKKPTEHSNYTDKISVTKVLLIFAAVIFGASIVHALSTQSTNTLQTDTSAQNTSNQQPPQTQQPTTITIPPAVQQKLEQQATPSLNSPSTTEASSGFDAGYNYAEEYQICDPSYSNGNSQDFNDGVNAWTADNCTDGQTN